MRSPSTKFYYLIIGAAAFVMPFLTGFFGLLPLDQCIIFEAAGRISKGEVPYTDFFLPYGLVTSLMQAVVFKLIGVSWISYLFHSAIINSIFAVILFDTLRLWMPAEYPKKFVWPVMLAAWSFYPMMGTPFMDNHSFFFGFLAYWSILSGMNRKNHYLLLLTFPLLVLGFYSKPLPVVFWIFPVILECWLNRKSFAFFGKWLTAGVALALVLAAIPFWIFDAHHFFYYTYLLPFHIAQARISVEDQRHISNALVARQRYKIWLGFIGIALAYFFLRVRRQEDNLRLAFWRSSCILLVSIIGAALTLNTFYPLVLTAGIITFTVWSKFNFKLSYSVLPASVINALFSLGWIILIVLISWINFSRRANDMVFHLKDIRNYSPELGLFPKTVGDQYSLEDLSRLYRLMKNENCLYVGDMMFFYSLTDRPNPWPVIHLHDGTSYNSRDSVSYAETRSMLVKNLVKYKTTLLIQDILVWGPEPFVQFAYQLKGKVRQRIGNLIVYEIDKEKLAWMASNLNIILDK